MTCRCHGTYHRWALLLVNDTRRRGHIDISIACHVLSLAWQSQIFVARWPAVLAVRLMSCWLSKLCIFLFMWYIMKVHRTSHDSSYGLLPQLTVAVCQVIRHSLSTQMMSWTTVCISSRAIPRSCQTTCHIGMTGWWKTHSLAKLWAVTSRLSAWKQVC